MAYFHGSISSEVLGMDTGLTVILPQDSPAYERGKPCKVLYLLHGLAQDATAWTRNTSIERYATQAGFVVVMPEVQRGFYLDMAMGQRYYTYTAHELPHLCEEMFHISPLREDTFIAGLSMGGYGAVRCALLRPEKYYACASFSGVLDLRYVLTHEYAKREKESMKALLGNDLVVLPENDCYELARVASKLPEEERPRFFLTCGEQDYLRDVNIHLRDFLVEQGFRLTYQEWKGAHDWEFWDRSVKLAIDFFRGVID